MKDTIVSVAFWGVLLFLFAGCWNYCVDTQCLGEPEPVPQYRDGDPIPHLR